jgi:hypothetical protein
VCTFEQVSSTDEDCLVDFDGHGAECWKSRQVRRNDEAAEPPLRADMASDFT